MNKRLAAWVLLLPSVVFSTQPTRSYSQQAQTEKAAVSKAPEASYNATADPRAIVIFDHARFTVLTPQLIRMEWSADGKFEDHPSFVFLNRRLPVPKFTQDSAATGLGSHIPIDTGALKL